MVIFLNDDRAYLAWVTHHRQGFVIDGKRKPRVGHLVIHRATCSEIKAAPSRRIHWTCGGKLKACGLDRAELEAWAIDETGAPPGYCQSCQPQAEASLRESASHLSKTAGDMLEYILEAALIHLEVEQPPYRLTAGDIAACFGKTTGQISPALRQLVESGFLSVPGYDAITGAISPRRMVFPTVTAMRTLEAFQTASDATIETELAKLESE